MHPATLDASLHLGALLAATDTIKSSEQSTASTITVRVPSALAAFWTPGGVGQVQSWATAGDVSLQPDDSALSSYWLASLGGRPGGASMQQLLAKPMTGAPRAAPKTVARERTEMLYTLHWKAAEAAPAGAAPAPLARHRRHVLSWRTIGRPAANMSAESLLLGSKSGSGVGGMNSAGLARIQQVVAGRSCEAAGLQLSNLGVISAGPGKPGRLSSATAAAGASGLLRTAAQEYPAMMWQAQASDALASRHSAAAAGTDAFGVRLTDGVTFLPQMLPSEPRTAANDSAPFMGHSGSVVISGGLGDIGAMLGVWAGQDPGLHVHLLGRSGHVQPALTATIAAMPLVTISRCDVGTREETRSLDVQGPLRQIWHAGGILQDGTLPKQTAAMMRAAAAPKLPGVLNLMAMVQGSPLENVALFSSTAALLGPAGQGNYAAANAQLNAWAQHAQATGGLISSNRLFCLMYAFLFKEQYILTRMCKRRAEMVLEVFCMQGWRA